VGDELFVSRGVDRDKDQSYFLYRLETARLARMVMPLGTLTKSDVREIARSRGLPVADTPESQELCFVPDGDRSRVLAGSARPGKVVDTAGNTLGEHSGVAFFTLGQRRGLGLGGGPSRVVVELDAEQDRVVVGHEAELERDRLVVDQWVDRDFGSGPEGLVCRTIGFDSARELPRIDLATPDRAPAPGQAMVLDREGIVVGGGRLVDASLREEA
jgi:tRNA-specific 2-thiouridylase